MAASDMISHAKYFHIFAEEALRPCPDVTVCSRFLVSAHGWRKARKGRLEFPRAGQGFGGVALTQVAALPCYSELGMDVDATPRQRLTSAKEKRKKKNRS